MLLTAIIFLLILSVLVLIHEAGHFVAAKRLGIRVEEFGFGLPPRLFGIKRGETIYSINWLPIGGFVKLFGEEGEEEANEQRHKGKIRKSDKSRAFYLRPPWQRAIVVIAGVMMNFILAITVISYLFTQGVMVPVNRVHIEKIVLGSPAEIAGLKENDIIKRLSLGEEKTDVKSSDQIIQFTKNHLGQIIDVLITRNGKDIVVPIVPRSDYPKDQGPMGVVISNYEEKKYSAIEAPFFGTMEAIILWKMISFQPVPKDVTGPIGIAQMTGQAIKFGKNAVLELLGILSLNLAIVNILPFPALDGGRLLFIVIEGLTGKKIRTNWERYIHQIGMLILLSLMVLVTIHDLIRIFSK
jgi:regulator of sigma E protease